MGFEKEDDDGTGDISWEEFEDGCASREMREYFKIIDVDISEARSVFALIDTDGSGSVDPIEFVNGCIRLRGSAKAVELAMLMHETNKMNRWLKSHIHLLEQRITWIGHSLKGNKVTKQCLQGS